MGKTNRLVLQELPSQRKHVIYLPCMIGRSDESDLRISDPGVSKRHALIFQKDDTLWIEDLDSSNGVYLNDGRITGKVVMHPGDSFQLGQTQFLVSQYLQEPRDEKDLCQQTVVMHSLDAGAAWSVDQERLRLISEITTDLSQYQDLEVLGGEIFSKIKHVFKQDRGYLAAFESDGTLRSLLPGSMIGHIPMSSSILKRIFENGEAFLLEDAFSDVSFKEQESIIGLCVRSALCAPLIYRRQIYGVMYLDRNIPGAYHQGDLELLKSIAFMVSPLIENARLWSELNRQYTHTVDTLKQTQARLLESERKAAFVRLAQAMAHEIRNPLMAIGGLVRRLEKSGLEQSQIEKIDMVVQLAQRVETVLKEVDWFVKLPMPDKRLERIDHIIEEAVSEFDWVGQGGASRPTVLVQTPHVMIPFDPVLMKKAFHMVFREIATEAPSGGGNMTITVEHRGNALEVVVGDLKRESPLYELSAPELQNEPWRLGLFLNIAHKIVSDHGGTLLLAPGRSILPLLIRIPTRMDVVP